MYPASARRWWIPVHPSSAAGVFCVPIFVSATRARRSNSNFFALSVAKASVESMVRNLAEEVGPSGIRVNAVGGGMILTDVNAFMPQMLKDQIVLVNKVKSGQVLGRRVSNQREE